MDDPNYWRTVRDKVTGREVILSDEQLDLIQNLQKSKFPAATTDPYEVCTVDGSITVVSFPHPSLLPPSLPPSPAIHRPLHT